MKTHAVCYNVNSANINLLQIGLKHIACWTKKKVKSLIEFKHLSLYKDFIFICFLCEFSKFKSENSNHTHLNFIFFINLCNIIYLYKCIVHNTFKNLIFKSVFTLK